MCTWTEEGVYEGAMTEEPDESVTSMAAYEEGAGRWRLLSPCTWSNSILRLREGAPTRIDA